MATEKKDHTRFILIGLMLAILMSAMDNTIVTTAMGTIVADLGGMEQFVWVTSAYMVTVMAGTRFLASCRTCTAGNASSCSAS